MPSPFISAFLRTILFYFSLLLAVRIMGKREIGSLSAADLVVAILLAEMAIIPIEDPETSVFMGLIPIATIVTLEIVLSYTMLKSELIRRVIEGQPVVVIENGNIIPKAMKKMRYNVDELLSQLREKGYTNPNDIEIAIVENDGSISIIPKAQKRPIQPDDLNLETKYESILDVLVKDGSIEETNLEKCNLSKQWLLDELKRLGHDDLESIFLAMLDKQGNLIVQTKE